MRRLKTRLDALERQSQSTLSTAANDMLASCYGRLHAIFMPARNKPRTWPSIRRLRTDYISSRRGIPARSTGADDWKSSHDARQQLIASGLAVDVRGEAETTGLILTTLGRSTAYGLVASVIPTIPLGEHFASVLKTAKADRIRGGERWVSESNLFGIDCTGDSSKWDHYTDSLLEPCISGAVDSLCDLRGVAYYRHVHDFEPLPLIEDIEPNGRAEDGYVSAFVAEMDRRTRIEDTTGEIVIPLSVT
jgi:hypothetical protein